MQKKILNIAVLVVDSMKHNRDIIKDFLIDQLGYDVYLFENGKSVYEYISNLKTDAPILLIADLLIPDLNGLTLLSRLKDLRNIYTIVITGRGNEDDLKKAFDAGAIDFIRKPIHKIELISRVNNVIKIISTELLLKKVTVTDFLTEVYNRKYFIEQTEKEILKAKRYKNALSFILIDIDNFKKINDTMGHRIGDEVLKSFSRICVNLVKGQGFFSRLGGDEFIVTLTNSDIIKALTFAKLINNHIEKLDVVYNNTLVEFTISMGLTELSTTNNETTHEILVRVDEALYLAKSCGKNGIKSL